MPPPSDNPPPGYRAYPVQFTGSGGGYSALWLANSILSILTLGIYSAWAKVRTKRYFYSHTQVDGAAFAYHATPLMILRGRLIAVGVLVVAAAGGFFLPSEVPPLFRVLLFLLIALVVPAVIWYALGFNAGMSSYRNVRFAFQGQLGRLYTLLGLVLWAPIAIAALVGGVAYWVAGAVIPSFHAIVGAAAVVMVFLLTPYIQQRLTRYNYDHLWYGQANFSTTLCVSFYYRTYMKIIGWAMLLLLGVMALFWAARQPYWQRLGAPEYRYVAMLVTVVVILFSLYARAFLQTRIRNHVLSNIQLQDDMRLVSNMQVRRLFWVLLSNFALWFVTLGLAYPWTVVRLTRYRLQTLCVHVRGDLDGFISQAKPPGSAIGEELGETEELDEASELDLILG